uniref:Promyelocytic leukemia n=1 Tax=Peromyscus maniculatus bairdii TaxID=230844 RepID=A0A8C8UM73_PERMB
MQKAPSPTGSPCLQQDPALTPTPTMPPPEDPSEDHEHSQSPAEVLLAMKEEFQFLCCPGCKAQARCPKLLPCLHTLCSGCLEAQGLRCPVCQAPGAGAEEALDNVFFESLQRRLAVFRQIVDAQAACTRCKESADFWCFECEQLMCHKCFDAHQWYLKHEARPLAELRDSSVREFLDSTRKSNIFCSNTNHRTPAPTNIYCRGCAKPLCCACALLDGDHNHLRCDIGDEIQQRYEELGTMTQALQEQDRVFDSAHAQMRSTIGQLEHARADTEARIRARVRQVVEHVQAQERQLLEAVNARYQRDYQEIAGQLGHLEAVLQRIRSGGALVDKMKLYASDQEVLDMHSFLRKALCRLSQEEPQNQQVQLRTSGFEEFKWCLQDLISCITQRTDAAVARRATPEAASIPRDSFDLEQRTQAQALRLSKTPPVAVVQSVPGAHPVPVYAFSMKEGSTYREEASQTITPMKRKCCHSDCHRKIIKMESTEEDENRLISSSPEQPRPSTSRAISPPHLDGPPSPESPIREKETPQPTSNHVTSDTEKTEERIVVISSSEDSDTENLVKPPDTTATPSSPSHSALLSTRRASHPLWTSHSSRACSLPQGTCQPPAWSSHHPTEQAAGSDTESSGQPTTCQKHPAVLCQICIFSHKARRVTRLHDTPGSLYPPVMPPPLALPGLPPLLPDIHQWLCNLVFLPCSSVASQPNAFSMGSAQVAVFEISLPPPYPLKRPHPSQSRPRPSVRQASENLSSSLLRGCLPPHATAAVLWPDVPADACSDSIHPKAWQV